MRDKVYFMNEVLFFKWEWSNQQECFNIFLTGNGNIIELVVQPARELT